ncbi:T9SS type A sorting domain-containing protein [uncultured Dokdonia sp.]|uniref:T9SS type A sorting domain-containing protein n=1 Tax=uncultured Dokdonia sp. TaxID=575653 RepID=UPI0026210DE7|nr:T9SS type A sorting domain-containing protein [uncultured Dokdonia sp.]
MKQTILFLTLILWGFTINAQAPNDECIDRETITVTTSDFSEYTIDTSTATESIDTSCEFVGTDNLDVWYEFTMPVNGNVRVTNIPSTVSITLFDTCGGNELGCFFNDGFIYDLNATTTYVLRVSEVGTSAGTVNFRIQAFERATNDACSSRETITVNTTEALEYTTNTATATESIDASCEFATTDNLDVWYEFTMPVNGNVRVTNIPSSVGMSIFDTCGGNELGCFFNDGFFYDLNEMTTYVLRLSEGAFSSGDVSFNIQAFERATNDACSSRETITVTTTEALEYTTNTAAATESINASCEFATTDNLDVWYEFTMPVNGNVRVTNIPSSVGMSIFDTCGGNELGCFFNDGFFYDLNEMTTYVLRLSEGAFSSGDVSFNIQAFERATNDACSSRETITVTTTEALEYTTNTATATESLNASCEFATTDNLDVWYEFTMPVNGNVRVTNIPSSVGMSIFDMCGGNELGCFFNDGFFYDLNEMTTYVLRLSEGAFSSGDVSFNIQAFERATNDACSSRETITVNTTEALEYTTNTAAATESMNASCEFTTTDNLDVWYEFTMPVNGNVRVTNIASTVGVSIFDACGGTELGCFFNDGYFYSLSEMTTYILRVSEGAFSSGDVSFTIQAFEAATNDACDAPQPIEVLQETTTVIPVDNRGATESIDASCDTASVDNLDLWYSFTMPVNGTVEISAVANSEGFTLYEECSGEEIDCFYNDGSFFELINGNSYLLRVNKSSFNSNAFDFTIQAVETDPQPCSDSTIWDGNSWSNGVPDNTKSALFNGNYNTIFEPESINACSCTIASGRTVAISDGFYLRSVFDITVEGTLNVANEGSIVQVAEDAVTINNGSINVTKTTPSIQARNFIALSSPMNGESRDQVYGSSRAVFGIIPSNFVPFVIDFVEFPEFEFAENFLDDNLDYLDEYTGTRDVPEAGIGLLVFPSAEIDSPEATYDLTYNEGTLHSGTITVPINYNGPETTNNYNLLGNPYASAIDVNAFITTNDAVNEVFYWEHITNPSEDLPGFGSSNFSMNDISVRNALVGISAVNGGTAPGQFMSSGQGFAIKADQSQAMSNTPVTFTNGIRVIGNNDNLRTSENTSTDLLWLNLTTTAYEDATSQTAVGFTPQATPDFDPGYDTIRLGTFISLFTTLETGEQLAIQGRESFDTAIELTLGFATSVETEETYTISIDHFEGVTITNTPVFLIDQVENEIINLKENDYHFTTQRGIQPERFLVVFQERDVLDIEDIRFRESVHLYPNPATNQVTLTYAGQASLQELTIVDMNGKILRTISLENFQNSQSIDTSTLAKGMYFLRIQSTENMSTQKLIIK